MADGKNVLQYLSQYHHFKSAEDVIIGTESNKYLQEHQSKYPSYHYTIGGKGDTQGPII